MRMQMHVGLAQSQTERDRQTQAANLKLAFGRLSLPIRRHCRLVLLAPDGLEGAEVITASCHAFTLDWIGWDVPLSSSLLLSSHGHLKPLQCLSSQYHSLHVPQIKSNSNTKPNQTEPSQFIPKSHLTQIQLPLKCPSVFSFPFKTSKPLNSIGLVWFGWTSSSSYFSSSSVPLQAPNNTRGRSTVDFISLK